MTIVRAGAFAAALVLAASANYGHAAAIGMGETKCRNVAQSAFVANSATGQYVLGYIGGSLDVYFSEVAPEEADGFNRDAWSNTRILKDAARSCEVFPDRTLREVAYSIVVSLVMGG